MKIKIIRIRRHTWFPFICKSVDLEIDGVEQPLCKDWGLDIIDANHYEMTVDKNYSRNWIVRLSKELLLKERKQILILKIDNMKLRILIKIEKLRRRRWLKKIRREKRKRNLKLANLDWKDKKNKINKQFNTYEKRKRSEADNKSSDRIKTPRTK